jgi:hypothetical protein
MRLGNVTDSRDAATPEKWPESRDLTHVSHAVLCEAAASFVGQYEQVVILSRACVRACVCHVIKSRDQDVRRWCRSFQPCISKAKLCA